MTASSSSYELVIYDVDEPEANLLFQRAIRDRNFLHLLIVTYIVFHDLSRELACLLELFHLKKEPI